MGFLIQKQTLIALLKSLKCEQSGNLFLLAFPQSLNERCFVWELPSITACHSGKNNVRTKTSVEH
jgi:hypothetical protein